VIADIDVLGLGSGQVVGGERNAAFIVLVGDGWTSNVTPKGKIGVDEET
jgi:hypothetical protein